MNYYEHHLGDYAQATAHLSFVEDAAYSRLIRKYYAQEKPLPADVPAVQRLVGARLKEEREAVEIVLREFFELHEDGWHNRRCDEELARYHDKQAKAKRSAEARWHREPQHTDGNANAMRTHSEGNAHQTPDTSHQTPSSSTKKKSSALSKPVDVSDAVWGSFLTVRKTKKAAVTDLAILGIRREAVAAGITLEEALTVCCERGWAGFKADWYKRDQQPQFNNPADAARVTVPGTKERDPALVKIEQDRQNAAPPPAEVKAKMAELLGHMKVKA